MLPLLLCLFQGLASARVLNSAPPQEVQQQQGAESEDTDATPKKAKRVPGLLPLKVAAELDPGGRPTAPALYHEGALIIATDKGEAQSYDAETGVLQWKLGLPGKQPLAPTLFLPAGVLLAYRSGMLLLADPTTGQIHREQSLGATLTLPPVIGNDTLYLATEDGPIMAYAWEEAREVWRVSLGEPALAMSVGGGLLVVSGRSGSLVALDAVTGTPVWEFRGEGVFQAPATFDAKAENLFIGDSEGFFYSLSARTGKTRFRWGTGAAITVPPLVEEDHVFMVSYANTLFVYRPGNGHELWRANLPGRPASAPVRVRRRVVVVTLDGQVVEFGNAPRASTVIPYAAPSEILPFPSYKPDGMVLPLRSGKILLLKTKAPKPPAPETPPTGGEEESAPPSAVPPDTAPTTGEGRPPSSSDS
jgi:outer membrane protein assembly factor BamB